MATREEVIQGLRDLIDWFEANEDLYIPWTLQGSHSVYAYNEEDLLAKRKLLHGKVEKVFTDYNVGFKKSFGGDVTLSVVTDRGTVCEKVKVGERHVEAVEAHTEDIYEWKCPDSILKKVSNA